MYVLGGICPGGKCPGGKCPGGICPGGKCPGGICPGVTCPFFSVLSPYIGSSNICRSIHPNVETMLSCMTYLSLDHYNQHIFILNYA